MTKQEMQSQALDRATTGAALTNYPAIYAGFMAKGIAEADIQPRVNVFTFHAWQAKGRVVRKGEHGVKINTFVSGVRLEKDAAGGEVEISFRSPRMTTVFHVSQTDVLLSVEERQAERQAVKDTAWKATAAGVHERVKALIAGESRVTAEQQGFKVGGFYNTDPGEIAADAWAAENCPSDNR